MKLFKTLAWTLGVLIVLAAVLGVAGSLIAARFTDSADGTLNVWLHTVETGDLTETFSAPGKVQALTEVQISARVAARIQSVPHGEGDRVTAGQPHGAKPTPASVLIQLDASDLQAQLDASTQRRDSQIAATAVDRARIDGQEAAMASTRSALQDAERNLQRQTQLQATGDVSARILEDARQARAAAAARLASDQAALKAATLGLEVSSYNIASAQADIRRIQENLAYTTLTSPIDGVVTRVNVEPGEIAVTGTPNNPGTVLLEVADLSALVVVARVDESNINRIRAGQSAKIRIGAYPNQIFPGTVQRVALSTARAASSSGNRNGASTAHFETRIRLDTLPDPVRTGLSATAEIQADVYHDVLLVPNQSVLSVSPEDLPKLQDNTDPTLTYNVGGRTTALAVYTVRNGKAQLVAVEIGASDTDYTVITRGLNPGDQVISGPFATLSKLSKNAAVNVTKQDGKTIQNAHEAEPDAPAGS